MLPKAENPWTINEAAHLLNRAGFGGSPQEIEQLHAMGREKAVDSLLDAEDAAEAYPKPSWATLEQALVKARERFQQRREMMREDKDLSPEKAEKKRRELRKEMQLEQRRNALEGQGWWFHRMLGTKAPLREKMTLFWHDHFATSIQKVRQPFLMLQQNELFRSHAFGSFRDLTQAIVVDPAMLLYLDTQNSRKGKPNENFAREVMELFTLGEGNYSEGDIREAARAFTGYDIDRFSGKVTHKRRQWDETDKTIFGKTGPFDGEAVVNLIFEKPEAANFISRKIWEFFAYDKPAQPAVDALAATLRKADYQIKPLLREIFLSKEFYSENAIRYQIKSPVQFLIGMFKQFETERTPFGFPITAQQQLGQILFMPPNVAGWDWGQAWINTNTLLTRYNLSGFVTKGLDDTKAGMEGKKVKIPGVGRTAGRGWNGPDYDKIAPRALREDTGKLVDALIFRFFQGPIPDKARTSFIEYANTKKGAIFTNKETAELCHLMLSTPYYQLC